MQVGSSIATLPTAQTDTTASSAQAAATLDYNAFLKLLIAQLQNQDPTNPMDSTEYMAQLAAFSNVEQAIRANVKLDSLLTASALTQADGLIGRTVTSDDGTVSGKIEAVRITSGGAVALLAGGKEVPLVAGITVSG
ncbi:MAG TPA: flagellar hook assembly protein FlgD [Hyphomicrobiaceae bacterium]|nr:flagellar hook assembly protein FlgD [Hyphomicrobiaceae bacterium]